MGALVSATEAKQRIRAMQLERIAIGEALGLKDCRLRWHPERIRLKTLLRLRRLYRLRMGED